jgi:hypothetical protein
MNAAVERAERRAAVRDAARGWRRAGLIDEATTAAIEGAYPDDRRRLGPVFRSLAFLFTLFAGFSAYAFFLAALRPSADVAATLALLIGVGLWSATEGLKGPMRVADAGVESATGLAGLLFMTGASVYVIFETLRIPERLGLRWLLLTIAALATLSVLRWGSTVSAGLAACALGLLLVQFPAARLTWIVAALVLAPLALYGSQSARLPPSQRRCCAVVLILALVGLYAALHIGSWDGQLLERDWVGSRSWHDSGQPGLPRAFFKLTTTLVPLAILGYAVATRRRLLLGVGLALGVASLITLRLYVHIAPLWVILSASGAGLILLALALRRWLDGGGGQERAGWTVRALRGPEAGTRAAEIGVAVVAATPSANAPESPRFESRGGRSGGGGASADF